MCSNLYTTVDIYFIPIRQQSNGKCFANAGVVNSTLFSLSILPHTIAYCNPPKTRESQSLSHSLTAAHTG